LIILSSRLNPMRKNHNSKKIKYTAWFLGALVVAIFLFGFGIYTYQWQSKGAYYIARVVPYPALLVDWEFVPLYRYLNDLSALTSYWDFQRDNTRVLLGIPDEKEIRERLVHKLITEQVVAMWARKHGITVSDQELYVEWNRLKEAPEGEKEISQFLDSAYGWTDSQYIQRVLAPFLLQQKVKNALIQEFGKSDEDLEQETLSLYVLASEDGADFSKLAKEYSYDSSTSSRGGDLGYFGRGTLDPVLEQAIFSMNIGEVSKPVKSSFGYHILKLDDLLYDDSGVAVQARAKHILVRGFDFEEWIEEQKRGLSVFRLVR